MAAFSLLTARRDPDRFTALVNKMPRAPGPAFLAHDRAVTEHWPKLDLIFPDYQFCLVDERTGAPAGIGNSLPLAFAGPWTDLPPEGLDWALEKGVADHGAGRAPSLMSALYIEVAATHRGRGVSAKMLAAMREIAAREGFRHLIAPVRPSQKSSYPLIAIETYLAWSTPEGLPFDPWLRVHVRAGGTVLHPCPRAMNVAGSRTEWAGWTEMDFPSDGDYAIPYGLVPVRVRDDFGEYVEPGVWVLHEAAHENS